MNDEIWYILNAVKLCTAEPIMQNIKPAKAHSTALEIEC
jgi:hypothetical protein